MAFTPTEEAQLRAVIEAFESGKTISEILASTEVFTTDVLEIVQSAVSKKATIAQIVTLVNSELGIGSMSTKLSGIEAGAQVNIIESVKVNNTVLPVSSKSVNITVPTQPSDIGAQPEGDYATNTQLATKEPANANIQTHIGSTSNPHSVTKTQVGLGNVDNTSDVNKPISSAQQTALNLKVDKVTGSSLVADTEILANRTAVKKVTTLTVDGGQLTGFVNPIAVDVSYNGETRKITLTGDVNARWQGIPMTEIIPSFVSGWQSEAHDIADGEYLLSFNGTSFVWSTVTFDFKQLQIAFVYRDGVNVCLRECHGLQDWQSHEANHNNVGTVLRSGADVAGFTLNSDVVANRRPTISQALVYDEDLPSNLLALTNGLYTRLFLDGANNANFETDKTDIVEYTAGNRFLYNLFTGGVWTKATAANNQYAKIFLMAIPTTSDADCQKSRYVWIMPQTVNATLLTIQALAPSSVNLGQISTALAEYVFVQEFIIRATASGWTIISTAKLTGNKRFQSVTSGNFLSSVAHDTSIIGDGTSGNPLGTTHAILPNKNEELAYQHLNTTAEKTTPIDADSLGLWDSVAGVFKMLTIANLVTWLNTKYQAILVSGTNIKTVNGNSLLGSGNVGTLELAPYVLSGLDADIEIGTKVSHTILEAHSFMAADIYLESTAAPTDFAIEVDVKKNGTSIFTTKPKIAAGSLNLTVAPVLVNATTTYADGDVRTISVESIGTTETGKNLVLSILMHK